MNFYYRYIYMYSSRVARVLKTMDAPTDSATVTGARVVPEEHTEV
jgi:hypothetical protein